MKLGKLGDRQDVKQLLKELGQSRLSNIVPVYAAHLCLLLFAILAASLTLIRCGAYV